MSAEDSTHVPFNDLGRGTALLRAEIDDAIGRVLESGWYVMGPEHNALESELSEYLGVSNTVLVGNGTDALQLALLALGVEADDQVLTAANAGGYTSVAARTVGAVPVYTDVDPATLLVGVEQLDAALATGIDPKVVVVTHLFGSAADIAPIVEWAHARGIAVVEDCAQSLGAVRDGKRAGSFGDIATTSFYPTKNLGALGDGGAVFTSDDELAARVRQLRQYGWESKYRSTLPGGRNSRMDELQAAVVRVKLSHLDEWNERRRSIHARYEAAIGSGRARLVNRSGSDYVGHLAVVEVEDVEAARAVLDDLGIRTDVHYPIPDHLQPIASADRPSLPVTEASANRIFSIPLFPELRDDEIERVAASLERIA
ncbi:MAG: DegT/DnrJ/EryC1/StrS family aminotransferase [Actinobacteria bacterium]|nr:DegT/DnrJ/EryC1/StrS family aminotransferase [Actinomycetota bacterium]